MFVACTEIEVTQCESTQLTEVSTKVYESIGPNSQYVDGEVVQGEPRKTPLTKESADAVRQSLVELAVKSISVVQLKLQAGRKLTDTERVKLDSVLDYIDALSAIDTSKAPDIEFPPQSL
ncbi:TPA: tail fiber assembly protein [Serratia marcescens]|nr:tail fiber assembly protein [Serratia marcescens]